MEIIFDTDRLLPLLKDFHEITQYRVGVYDSTCNEVLAYPAAHSHLCALIRGKPEGLRLCKECDYNAYLRAKEMQGVYVYNCHVGLMEAMVPIIGYRKTIGYLMVGQLRQDDHNYLDNWEVLCEAARKLNIEKRQLQDAYIRLTSTDSQVIQACTHILQACAASVWMEKYITYQDKTRIQQLEQYVDEHLQSTLTLQNISAYLEIGKTTLCNYVKDSLGMSVNDFVRNRRIDRAKTLLLESSKPIAEIAGEVGITDYNYFSKVFKKQTGLPPRSYRKMHLDKEHAKLPVAENKATDDAS